ncbi:MAG: Xaa-Pro peptidase family protein [Peptococcaceae bacterium]|nr:Xaa-Pro peptidase family protein [Peptococcaceae bacterium]MDH7525074.1 Xaa-Pro peptidase family protein [Peptococcaceae bacterium]
MNKTAFKKRMEKLQSAMRAEGIDVCLLVDRENLLYFGGIEQVECMAVVVPREGTPQGTTLSLDVPWVRANCALEKVRGYRFPAETLAGSIIEIIKEFGYTNPVIGFERYFVGFAVFDTLRKHFDAGKFCNASGIIYKLRAVKDCEEIDKIKKASQAVIAGMKAAVRAIRPGVREIDLAAEAEYAAMKSGSQGTPFRIQIVSGEKTMLTHPFSDSKTVKEGEIVLIHIGARVQGYTAKMCRTAAVGAVPKEQKMVYEVLKKAQRAGIAAMKPGVPCSEVDRAARQEIYEAGFDDADFLDVIGHGIGLRQSEFYPMIGKNFSYTLQANMVVDILLPSIYRPGAGGSRITDTIWIRGDGAEVLTNYPADLIQA